MGKCVSKTGVTDRVGLVNYDVAIHSHGHFAKRRPRGGRVGREPRQLMRRTMGAFDVDRFFYDTKANIYGTS